jgi:hypothetical protein
MDGWQLDMAVVHVVKKFCFIPAKQDSLRKKQFAREHGLYPNNASAALLSALAGHLAPEPIA